MRLVPQLRGPAGAWAGAVAGVQRGGVGSVCGGGRVVRPVGWESQGLRAHPGQDEGSPAPSGNVGPAGHPRLCSPKVPPIKARTEESDVTLA